MTTVLVVDDEYLIVEVLTLALEDVGFMVTQASNGKKALDALHREGPSLVVCDYMMPLMNGMELAKEIRQHPEWAHIPIVLMSGGHAGLASQTPGLFDHILQKPFDVVHFLSVVNELVGDPPVVGQHTDDAST